MKNIIISSRLYTLILSFLLFAGIQNAINAQITVINATGCDINVIASQNDATTFVPCDLCPINPVMTDFIPAGQSSALFGQDVCGEQFGWIRWNIPGSFGTGSSPNPGLFGFCAPNVNGPPCSAIVGTSAFWFGGGGSGPVTVVIFG